MEVGLVKKRIVELVKEALLRAQSQGELPSFEVTTVPVERPRQAEHGDWATPIAMQLAKLLRMPPRRIAEAIVRHLPSAEFIGRVEVAGPGYVNFILSPQWLGRQVDEILAAGESFGNLKLGEGKRVQVEFVSANPTGPLHVGTGRNAVIGDVLARLLEAAGYQVQREYYVNDAGTQMRLFNQTLYARYCQALGIDEPIPEDGYRGTYMIEMGRDIAREHGTRFLQMERDKAIEAIGELGLQRILEGIRSDLELMDVRFDRWFSERSLYTSGLFHKVLGILRERGYVVERDGAVWFTSTELGDSKDNVIIRSDGNPGYFASDIAYHYDKFILRGFDWVIDVWSADHQGHVPRMKAVMRALGIDPERLTLLIYQMVTLKRGGEVVRLSKRTGDIITLREVLEEVGPDAVRYFLLSRSPDAQMDFDLELAKQESEENPVYYVQYAHARIASILRYAQGREDIQALLEAEGESAEPYSYEHPMELNLIRKMLLLPEVIEQAVTSLAPHLLPQYALDLASTFHAFYRDCRVVSSDPADIEVTRARLKLVRAAKIVLARALRLMGVKAPERM